MKDATSLFKDPHNPTKEEIKVWAYDGDYYQPVEDWPLFVVDDPYFTLELATDPSCPTRDFFLQSLYIWIGDTVRGGRANEEKFSQWLTTAKTSTDERIKLLIERTENLVAHPETYDYGKWGLGGSYGRENSSTS